MPQALPFNTLGAGNGFPSCVPKVDVSGYDHWTTFSGHTKTIGGIPNQASIDASLVAGMKLFWNLYRVTLATGHLDFPLLEEVIVSGWDALTEPSEPPPIEPKGRVCGGSLTRGGNTAPNLGDVDLRLATGFSRMYNGVTSNEANFIGYGGGVISTASSFDPTATIATWYIPVGGDPASHLGGYSTDDFSAGITYEYDYVVIEGVNFLWLGRVDSSDGDPDTEEFVDSATLRAWMRYIPTDTTEQAQILDLEFYTYP